MRKLTVLLALALFTVSLAAVAGDKKPGEKKVSGTISKLDMTNRTLIVTDEKSASWTIQWNDSTRVMGDDLREGGAVTIGYVETDGKMWAAWIKGAAKS